MELPDEAKEIFNFWYGDGLRESYKQKWFSDMGTTHQEEIDLEVTRRFCGMLQKAECGEYDGWAVTPRGLLALVLLLDQFSRHIHRHSNEAQIKENDKKALELTHFALEKHWDSELHVEEIVFLCMPIRHSASKESLRGLLERIDRWLELHEERSDLLKKFQRTTLSRLQHMEGREGDAEDILEFHPFQADESTLLDHKVTRVVEAFLEENLPSHSGGVLVSLSGGVDSMVLTKVLVKLSAKFNHFKVAAAHVDYANRAESGAEAAFVDQWCADNGVVFRMHRIEEMKRGVTLRDEYEKAAREIRYKLYGSVMAELAEWNIPACMVGHHKGDVQENVISNMMKGCSLLDLAGMATESLVNGIKVWRPLLPLPKSDIFDFAHKFGVPYFKDTTPTWSTRGKVRRQLLPLLKEIYGEGFPAHLSALASDSHQLNSMTHAALLDPFFDSLTETQAAVMFDCKPYFNQQTFFWREALKRVCHESLGIGVITEGAISVLIAAFAPAQAHGQSSDSAEQVVRLNLKKGLRSYLIGSTLVLFRPSALSRKRSWLDGQRVPIGEEVIIGSWTVTLTLGPAACDSQPLSIMDIASGAFSYSLPHPANYMVLRPGKKGRPKSLRQLDKSLTDELPLVLTSDSECDGSCENVIVSFRCNSTGTLPTTDSHPTASCNN